MTSSSSKKRDRSTKDMSDISKGESVDDTESKSSSKKIKIAQYIGSMYGGDIMGELETKKEFVTPPTENPLTALARKTDYENMIRAQQGKTLASLR